MTRNVSGQSFIWNGNIMAQVVVAIWALSYVAGASAQTLHVYGPGGPLAPMQACAAQYTAQTHHPVIVTGGPEKQWFAAAQMDGDVIYGGAEYMLTQFDMEHPGFLLAGSRTDLYKRTAGILVRPGNPKHIQTLADLAKPGIRLLDVSGAGQLGLWEDVAGRFGLIDGLQQNIALTVATSAEGMQAWATRPQLDAWITYESWQQRMPDKAALVRLPPEMRIYRGTPIAFTQRSTLKVEAKAFLAQLRTPACHDVFIHAGWQ